MALETATYIADLVPANPVHGDQVNQADAHMRLIKAVLQATFAGFTSAPLASSQAQIDAAVAAANTNGVAILADAGAHFKTNTTDGIYNGAAGEVDIKTGGTVALKATATKTTFPANVELTAGDMNIISGAFKLAGTSIFPLQSANIGASQVLTAAIADANVTTAKLADASVTTAKLADGGVTLAKHANVGASKLIGNPTGSSAAPSEITIGNGLKASGSTLNGAPAAWVNFSVSGTTVTINASFNVASVTRTSTGVFVITFTNAMADANYCMIAMAQRADNDDISCSINHLVAPSTTSFGLTIVNNGGYQDPKIACVTVFGN